MPRLIVQIIVINQFYWNLVGLTISTTSLLKPNKHFVGRTALFTELVQRQVGDGRHRSLIQLGGGDDIRLLFLATLLSAYASALDLYEVNLSAMVDPPGDEACLGASGQYRFGQVDARSALSKLHAFEGDRARRRYLTTASKVGLGTDTFNCARLFDASQESVRLAFMGALQCQQLRRSRLTPETSHHAMSGRDRTGAGRVVPRRHASNSRLPPDRLLT